MVVKHLKHNKNQLSFSANSMKWVRTPKEIWEQLSKEFRFTVDVCASDVNHLLPKYYTKENDGLKQDWSGEVAYIHPLFDTNIWRWVKKASKLKILQEYVYYLLQFIVNIFTNGFIIILIVKLDFYKNHREKVSVLDTMMESQILIELVILNL